MKIAAFVLILLALFNFNNTLALAGVNIGSEIKDNLKSAYCTLWFCDNNGISISGEALTEGTITITQVSYQPQSINVKKGEKITLHLVNKNGQSCIQAFTIPSLGIQRIIPVGSSDTITFKAPEKPTQIPFMCSMGMFRGVINVI